MLCYADSRLVFPAELVKVLPLVFFVLVLPAPSRCRGGRGPGMYSADRYKYIILLVIVSISLLYIYNTVFIVLFADRYICSMIDLFADSFFILKYHSNLYELIPLP